MQIVLLDYERGRVIGRKLPDGMSAQDAVEALAASAGVGEYDWMSGRIFADLNFTTTNGVDSPYINPVKRPDNGHR